MVAHTTHTSDDTDALHAGTHVPLSFQKQCVLDAAQRMRKGVLLYSAIWAVLMQADNFVTRHPYFALINGLVLLAGAALRLGYNQGLKERLERNFRRTQLVFRAQSLAYNAYWGTLCAIVLVAPDAENLRWLMLMSTVGITAGGTVIVAIESVLPLLYPFCTLGPTVLAVLPRGGSVNLALAALIGVFFLYSLSISRLVGREYWARQRSQALLEQRARELEALSRTDALTQIPNRLKFQESLSVAWRDARRRREPLAIAMVDLDYFKHINDNHGHPFGDVCLQAAAKGLSSVLRRPVDMVARFGGEEFVVLLPNTDEAGALKVAQAMLDKIKQTFISQDGHSVLLSCSIGVSAQVPGMEDPSDMLVKQADAALYVAKQSGRGRVTPYRDPQTTEPAQDEQTPGAQAPFTAAA
ncbi:MAG TPA: GGDEF domain-containing protein [Aquabacterium sp.]|uniref:GGDEF domain-containing protein n=1 Tax=Aquabacterium sp. TaxID=1872578 RepID=UPI002E36907F|nr:GGDEF domain-containing protein [Aquabacterium sp.]HEX5356474.1 GGDEF domain-containing protein [Aquabacterium sp.]